MLDSYRIELSKTRLEKARREHQTAVINRDTGFFDAANNRAYYTIFHAIRAVLALDGVDFKTHSRVIGYFNSKYFNTDLIDRSLSEIVKRTSKSRTGSDYEDFYVATQEEVEKNIAGAEKLLVAVERYLVERLDAEHNSSEEYDSGYEAEDDEENDLDPEL